ncbi:hypothetical protein GAG94_03235 [Lysinibacillus sphaericus]|nr:hypothetical protein GAG94_03235 [Lysinibacillus sphaericus]
MSNHSRIDKTIAENVKLNLGGGADATVNLYLNEEGFLLVKGLGLDYVEYHFTHHDNDLLEIQLLYPHDYDEDCAEEL